MLPNLRNRPVLVVSGPDGISIANSKACSELGIPKFTPVWEVRDKVELYRGAIFRSNFNTLGHLSDRMMSSIKNAMGDDLPSWVYSVDEIFFDISKLDNMGVPLHTHLSNVRKRVYQECRIGTGTGAGRTLTLSKCASFAAKKLPGYNGQCILYTEKEENSVLKSMLVKDVWNCGSKMSEYLKFKGVTTAYDLKNQDPSVLKKEWNINASNIINELRGIPALSFDDHPTPKESIFSTASYRYRLKSRDSIATQLSKHAAEVCRKSRANGTDILAIALFVSTSRFDKCAPFHQRVEVSFDYPTDDTRYILKCVDEYLNHLVPAKPDMQPIYKVGVGAVKLVNSEMRQLDLFDQSKKSPLMRTIDGLNTRFGKGTISFAAENERSIKQEQPKIPLLELSNYLTRFEEIVTVKCV